MREDAAAFCPYISRNLTVHLQGLLAVAMSRTLLVAMILFLGAPASAQTPTPGLAGPYQSRRPKYGCWRTTVLCDTFDNQKWGQDAKFGAAAPDKLPRGNRAITAVPLA